MYEAQTYEVILKRMMERALAVNENLDSREGSMLWLGEAPAAVELQNLYIALDTILKETFADTASRESLILRAAERGITPEPATAAILQLTITPATLDLALNTRFSIGDLNYYVSENMGNGNFAITCETPGEAGNNYGDLVVPIEYVPGLETCAVSALLVPGEDEEDTESIRGRYFDTLNCETFGGNVKDYLAKVKSIPGVGGAKVFRAWNGGITPASLKAPEGTLEWLESLAHVPAAIKEWITTVHAAANDNLLTVGGTVKVVIIASNNTVPSDTLIENVQDALDPAENTGEGLGLAPIGHVVQVTGVNSLPVDVSFRLTCSAGYTWDDMVEPITEVITNYFTELAGGWEDAEGGLIIRISQLETRVLAIKNIVDVENTKINGVNKNYTMPDNVIPALGTLSPA